VRLAITLPISVLAGLVTGIAIFREPQSLSPNTAPAAVRGSGTTVEPAVRSDSTVDSDAKAQRLVAAVLRKGNTNERENEMYLAIEAFTAEDLRRIVGDVGELKAMIEKITGPDWRKKTGLDWQTGRYLISGLIRRWLELDRGVVTAWAPRALDLFPKDNPAHNWMLETLTTRLPEEMLALLPSRKDASERTDIMQSALRELAAKDPAKARAWIDGCTDPKDRREAEKAFRLGIVQTDPLRAVELAESIENRSDASSLLFSAAMSATKMGPGILRQLANMPTKPWMTAALIDVLAQRDPELAMELAMKSRGQGQDANSALCTAFAAMTRRDRASCMAKLEELQGRDLAAAVSAIGFTWAAEEPAAALSWLMQHPVAERSSLNFSTSAMSKDTLVMGFCDWMASAPAQARAWAEALPAGATRDMLQTPIARALAADGKPEEAIHVLARLDKAANPNAIAEIASAWARRDPQAAANWAITQEPGPVQSGALAGVVGAWANDDQQGVENWLAQFPPGDARDRSVQAFLWRSSAWTTGMDQRLAEFDTWFDLIDDPWQRALAARSSFWQRKSRDPAAARAWLSSQQNVDPDLIRATLRDNPN
jgi:hypothetical protein